MKTIFTLLFVSTLHIVIGQNAMVGTISNIDCSELDVYSILHFTYTDGETKKTYEMYMNEVVTLDEYPVFTTSHVWNEYEDLMTTTDFDSLEILLLNDEDVVIFYDSVEIEGHYEYYLLDIYTISQSPADVRTRESSIGSWSLKDMLEAYQIIHSSDDILYDSFGTDAFLIQSCYFSSAIAFYNNFEEADADTSGRKELSEMCINEYSSVQEYDDDYYDEYLDDPEAHYFEGVFLEEYSENKSIKGYWNYDDKMLALDAIYSVLTDLEQSLGEFTDDFIICYLFKIESLYDNFYSADQDFEGMSELAEDCTDEIFPD